MNKLFKELKDELQKAIPKAFKALKKQHSDICSFGICTTAIVESIVPIYQCESLLEDPDDSCRFAPWEWEMGDGDVDLGSKVPRIREKIQELYDNADNDCDEISETYLNTILEALVDLKGSKKLGKPSDNIFLTMWLAGDDEEWVIKSSEKLNPPELHESALEAIE